MIPKSLLSAAIAAALGLCACSSGTGSQICNGLEAIAGPAALSAAKRSTVTLAGSAAKSSGAVNYAWRLDAPAGSNAALSSASAAAPTFVPDVSGQYFATLFVRDACGTSAPSTAVITVANHAPVASAGPDRQTMPGETLILDGSASSDSDQDTLRYRWSIVSRPPGSSASLSNTTVASPTFMPDAYGTYVAMLEVSDGEDVSEPVEVVVKAGVTGPNGTCVPAAPPVASPGPDQTNGGQFGAAAQLDASASTSGRPGALTFSWTLSSAPPGSFAVIDQPRFVKAVLSPIDRRGTYVVTLVVNDGCVNSAPATVRIVRPNSPPQLIFVSAPFQAAVLAPFNLQAIAVDNDNDPLTCHWQLVSRPIGSTAGFPPTTSCFATFTPDVVGTYKFSAVASDPLSSSTQAETEVTVVDLPPTARVGPDQGVRMGSLVTLDGFGSTDPSLQSLTYAWTFLQKPAGSRAAMSDPAAPRPTFMADMVGVYRAQLTVTALRGTQSLPATTSVAAWPVVTRFAHKVTDAAYSTGLDLLITVASDQAKLFLLDPRDTAAEASVTLPSLATSVGLDPTGHFAAVGHAAAISLVDLVGKTVRTVPVLGEIQSLTLGSDHDVAFAFQSGPTSDHARLMAASFGTGATSLVISGQTGMGRGRFRAENATVYVTANLGFPSGGIEEYVLNSGVLKQVTLPAGAGGGTCGDLWLSQSAARMFTRCGNVLIVANDSTDLTSPTPNALGHSQNTSLLLRHLSDSTAGEISAVASADDFFFPFTDDRTLRRWAADTLAARESVAFPSETATSRWQGRFVFYRSDGTERYVLLQLVDQQTGVASDYGFVIF